MSALLNFKKQLGQALTESWDRVVQVTAENKALVVKAKIERSKYKESFQGESSAKVLTHID